MPAKRSHASVDHRSRVGVVRRAHTRQCLIESAMLVFAEHGAEASVIDEVIALAGVSRGTFYNYFRSNDELLQAVAEEVGNQMLLAVDPVVREHEDPAARVATGVRLVLGIARTYPRLAAFMVRVGPPAIAAQGLVTEYLPRDLRDGMAKGRFSSMHPRLAFDLVTGPVLAGFHSLLTAKVPPNFPDAMATGILLALGVARTSAKRLGSLPLPRLDIGAESLFVRAEARALQQVNKLT